MTNSTFGPAVARRGGHPPKPAALVLRDSYWAHRLLEHFPQCGGKFAPLEVLFNPGVRPKPRPLSSGEGKIQPHALSKVAKGTRGVWEHLEGEPNIVVAAAKLAPASRDDFRSILWLALSAGDHCFARTWRRVDFAVCDEVQALSGPESKNRWLTLSDVEALGDIPHRDALGVLLMAALGERRSSFPLAWVAGHQAAAALIRLAQHDRAFAKLQDRFSDFIGSHFPLVKLLTAQDYAYAWKAAHVQEVRDRASRMIADAQLRTAPLPKLTAS